MAYQFLDFYNILVNEVSGTATIFLALSIIFILVMAVKFKFDNQTIFKVLVIWLVIMSPFINPLLAIVLLIISFFVGTQINNLIRK